VAVSLSSSYLNPSQPSSSSARVGVPAKSNTLGRSGVSHACPFLFGGLKANRKESKMKCNDVTKRLFVAS
jgi:hypothetical protein